MSTESELDEWLDRFVVAHRSDFDQALSEVRRGKKTSHWMWYIFPQVPRQGSSGMAEKFAIPTLERAQAFLNHPVLGSNYLKILREVRVQIEKSPEGRTVTELFGRPDDLKFVSSITLMGAAARRAGLPELAQECEQTLGLALAGGMSECSMTVDFLRGV